MSAPLADRLAIAAALGLSEFYIMGAFLSRTRFMSGVNLTQPQFSIGPARTRMSELHESVRATPDLDCVIFPVRVDIDQREIRPFALWLDGDDVLVAFSAGFEFDDVPAIVTLAF